MSDTNAFILGAVSSQLVQIGIVLLTGKTLVELALQLRSFIY